MIVPASKRISVEKASAAAKQDARKGRQGRSARKKENRFCRRQGTVFFQKKKRMAVRAELRLDGEKTFNHHI
ncbi:hypothetical protein BSKO_02636 [Bryopsis sp. KO-2023]|nr:hypothetical protein BSKO_02636 [Bryopsis sp. KO-2023]